MSCDHCLTNENIYFNRFDGLCYLRYYLMGNSCQQLFKTDGNVWQFKKTKLEKIVYFVLNLFEGVTFFIL